MNSPLIMIFGMDINDLLTNHLSKTGQKIAVLGLAADLAVVGGGGSGSVVPSFVSTPLAGMRAAAAGGRFKADFCFQTMLEFNKGSTYDFG